MTVCSLSAPSVLKFIYEDSNQSVHSISIIGHVVIHLQKFWIKKLPKLPGKYSYQSAFYSVYSVYSGFSLNAQSVPKDKHSTYNSLPTICTECAYIYP